MSNSQKLKIKEYGNYIQGSYYADSNKMYLLSQETKFKFEYITYYNHNKDSCWFELPHDKVHTSPKLSLESTRFYEIKTEQKKNSKLIGVMSVDSRAGGRGGWSIFFIFELDPKTCKLIKYKQKELQGYTTDNFIKLLEKM
jgi:hypothetical protein